MNVYSLLEPLILGLALLACCAACLRRLAPGLWRRLLRQPAPPASSAACSSGCSTCGSCAPSTPADAAPIRFHSR